MSIATVTTTPTTTTTTAGVRLEQMRALPFITLDDLLGEPPALILAPHADDESLGCGGLIAEACLQEGRRAW